MVLILHKVQTTEVVDIIIKSIYTGRLIEKKKQEMGESKKHFILVHGACHGAWCWYKLMPLLMSAGHTVKALDLAASGIDGRHVDEVQSFDEYVQPLMETMASLPAEERVILVGHSYGGYGLSLAMERFPGRISVAVFATAMMPSYQSPPYSAINEVRARPVWMLKNKKNNIL